MTKNTKDTTITTNQAERSSAQVKVEIKKRALTAGEIAMSKLIFKDSVNYALVTIYNRRYIIGSGDNAMTPNGNMYFPKKYYKADFSVEDEHIKVWFIHEMVHVWQYQLGYPVRSNGSTTGKAYNYEYSAGDKLQDLNMEQQAVVIAEYYEGLILKNHNYIDILSTTILEGFLKAPSNKQLLPNKSPIPRAKLRTIYDTK